MVSQVGQSAEALNSFYDDKALLFINTIINKSFRLWCGPRYKQEKSKRTEQRYRNQDRHTDSLNYNHRPGYGSGFGKRWRMPVRERSREQFMRM
jgi:hypothetical protein